MNRRNVAVTISLPGDLAVRLDREAASEMRSRSGVVALALMRYLRDTTRDSHRRPSHPTAPEAAA